MEWKDIGQLLSGIKNKNTKKELDFLRVSEIVSETLGVKVSKEDITIKRKTVFVDCHPVVKNEILLRQHEIMGRLRDAGLEKDIDEVR